ncbi:MAG: hypothetical protein EP329_08915 [Deltaproteobacteria bacterium]|nr:MAG: hypothetical protein EP329_08915 [Deltaproteobacteria bacterium]
MALGILQDLAARMRKLRKGRRGKDVRLSGEVAYPAIAPDLVGEALGAVLGATPGADHLDAASILGVASEAPALLQPTKDGNLAFSTPTLHAALAGVGTLRAARRAGTDEAEILRQLWRAYEWRPIVVSVFEGHASPERVVSSVLARVSEDGTSTDWTLVMFLALDLLERRPWPRDAHLPLVHRCFDAVAKRVAKGTIGGQVVTGALAALEPSHRGSRTFRTWFASRFEQGGVCRAIAGAAFALSTVDAGTTTVQLLEHAADPDVAALALQLSAEPLLRHGIVRRLPPSVVEEAVMRFPDLLVLPMAVRCLVQGGPAGLARGLVRRLSLLYHGLQEDLRAWGERLGGGADDVPIRLEVTRNGELLAAVPLALRDVGPAPPGDASLVPLLVPILFPWRQTIYEVAEELLAHGGSHPKTFREALMAFEPAPKRVPLDADPAFALHSGAPYAAAFGCTSDFVFALGASSSPEPAEGARRDAAANGSEALSDDVHSALRVGCALATYVTMAMAPPERHVVHLHARLTSLELVLSRTAIQRFLADVWAPGTDAPLAQLAEGLHTFAVAVTGQ